MKEREREGGRVGGEEEGREGAQGRKGGILATKRQSMQDRSNLLYFCKH